MVEFIKEIILQTSMKHIKKFVNTLDYILNKSTENMSKCINNSGVVMCYFLYRRA